MMDDNKQIRCLIMKHSNPVIEINPHEYSCSKSMRYLREKINRTLRNKSITIVLADYGIKCEATVELFYEPTRELRDLMSLAALEYATDADSSPCIQMNKRGLTVQCENIESARELAKAIQGTFAEYKEDIF